MRGVRPCHTLALLALVPALLVARPAPAQPERPSFPAVAGGGPRERPEELIVRFRPHARASDRADVRARVNGRLLRDLPIVHAEHLAIPGVGVRQAIERLRGHPLIEYAEPNFEVQALLAPNDPLFPQMYNLRNVGQTGGRPGADIHATEAWELFTGDPEVRVAVLDTGVDYGHPDLAANIWTNPGEIPGNGIDDDRNGYVDDVHGYDFVSGDGDPFDDNGHGTHVAGIIAAVGDNGLGVTGVNWRARIVPLKILNAAGFGTSATAIAALGYAVATGVRVTNNSWGGGAFSQGLRDAIEAAGGAGQLFVAAAGNSAGNNDTAPIYPASYDSPYVLSVASTDHFDRLSGFSNYGATSVDLGAPGSAILSTLPRGTYGLFSGTSMAAPHVAGAVAFVLGRYPGMEALQARTQILEGVDPLPALSGRVATGGRLNLVAAGLVPDHIPPGAIADLATTDAGSTTMGLTWTATGDDGESGRAVRYEIRYATQPIDEADFATLPVAAGPRPQPAGAPERAEVRGLAFDTRYYFAIKAFDEIGNGGPISNLATGTTLGRPRVTVTPASLAEDLLTGAHATQTLTVRNDGEGTLDFTVPDAEQVFAQPVHEPLDLGKGEPDPRPGGPVLSGRGGPDAFGYRWLDSDDPDGPAFAWVDIATIGQPVPISGDDVISRPIAMGIPFPFYGNTFETVHICSNGFLTFTAGTGSPFTNQFLPTSGAPPNLLAPFWDDLVLPAQNIRIHGDGARFIVSWIGVRHYAGGGPYTFQVILHASGEILFQYLSMAPPTGSATVGIQDGTGRIGLTTAFNTAYARDGLALRYTRIPPWLGVSPRSGRVVAGQEIPLTVSFDAVALLGGDYTARLRVLSTDPDRPTVTIPVGLHVTGAPDLAVSPAALDFGAVFTGTQAVRPLAVSNRGTESLVVSGIVSPSPGVTALPNRFTLAPFAAETVRVTYAPVTPEVLSGALTVLSNDPDGSAREIPLSGTALPPPVASVSPASLGATVVIPGTAVQTLTIENAGGSPLVWSLGMRGRAPAVAAPAGGHATGWGGDHRLAEPMGPVTLVDPSPTAELPVVIEDLLGDGGPVDLLSVRASGSLGLLQVEMDLSTPLDPSNFGGFLSIDADRDSATGAPPSVGAPGHDIGVEYEVRFFTLAEGTVQLFAPGGTLVGIFPATLGPRSLRFAIPLSALGDDDGEMDVSGVIGTALTPTDWFPDRGHGTVLDALWLSAGPEAGVVEPGGRAEVTVAYGTAGLSGGDYPAGLTLTTNDPARPRIDVPITLTALPAPPPDLALSADTVRAAGATGLGPPALRRARALTVRNAGGSDLHLAAAVATAGAGPSWLTVSPARDTIPPGASRTLDVLFDATGLPDGAHGGHLRLTSDDPHQPVVEVPCVFRVGVVGAAFDVDPNSLHGSSRGRWVAADVELPAGLEPRDIVLSTVRLQRTVPIDPEGPVTYRDEDEDGLLEARYRFARARVLELLERGRTVSLEVTGEVRDVTWFQGFDQVRSPAPGAAEPAAEGEPLPAEYGLRLAGPSPGRGRAAFALALPERAAVGLRIYDVRGRLVRELIRGELEAGRHRLAWDGAGSTGAPVPAGVYLAHMMAGGREFRIRVVLLR